MSLDGCAPWRFWAAPTFVGALAVGLLCGYWETPVGVWACAWGLWSAVLFANRLAFRLSPRRRAAMIWVAAMMCAATLGAAGINRIDSLAQVSVARFAGRDIMLTGAVISARTGGRSPEVVVAASLVGVDGTINQASGRIRIFLEAGDASQRLAQCLRHGDIIESRVQLKLASRPMNPGEPDLRAVFLQQGIHALADARAESVRIVGRRRLNPIERIAQLAHDGITAAARATLAPEQRQVFLAMALGDSGELDSDTLGDFRRAGVSHLLAASGLHVSLVAGIVIQAAAAAGLSSRRSPMVAFLVAGIYAVVAGLRPSIVRAWLMFGLSIVSQACGRCAGALRIVCMSASVQLMLGPLLLWNSGFQMSYLAILALSYLAPCLARVVPSRWPIPAARVLRTLLASVAVTAAAFPVAANMTCEVSLVGPIANLIAVPMGLVAMAAGLCGCVVWRLWPWLGCAANAGAGAVLTALIRSVRAMSALPFASVPIRMLQPLELVAYYGVLASVCAVALDPFRAFRFARAAGRFARHPAAALCTAALALILILGFAFLPAPLEVVVMSVGQGDAIFVSVPREVNILIDAGTAKAGEKHVVPYLRRRGVKRIDLLVITHEHADHAGGADAVARAFTTGCIVVPDGAAGPKWEGILSAFTAAGGNAPPSLVCACWGDSIQVGSATLKVLNPPRASPAAARGIAYDANENSVVLRLQRGGFSMLLCADAGVVFERRVLSEPAHHASLASQVVKIGHHGSATASSSPFLEAVDASWAIVSVGSNGYGHPSPAAVRRILDAGPQLRQTDTCGAIAVSVSPFAARAAGRWAAGYAVRDMQSVWARAPMFRKLST